MSKRNWTDEQLIEAVASSTSLRQVILKLFLTDNICNYKSITERIKILKIPFDFKRKGRSWTEEQLITAVASSTSIRQILDKLNLKPAGGNYKQLHSYIKKFNLSTFHFTGQGHLKGKTHNWSIKIPIEEVLIKGSLYKCSNTLRKRLIKEGLLEAKCSSCHLDTWLDQPMRLELDHINGNNTDNRIENLRILCPNCHSLTTTYRGKNKKN